MNKAKVFTHGIQVVVSDGTDRTILSAVRGMNVLGAFDLNGQHHDVYGKQNPPCLLTSAEHDQVFKDISKWIAKEAKDEHSNYNVSIGWNFA